MRHLAPEPTLSLSPLMFTFPSKDVKNVSSGNILNIMPTWPILPRALLYTVNTSVALTAFPAGTSRSFLAHDIAMPFVPL